MAVFIAIGLLCIRCMPEVQVELGVTSQSEVRSLFAKGDYDIIIHTAGTLNAGRDEIFRTMDRTSRSMRSNFQPATLCLKANPKPKLFLSLDSGVQLLQ